MIRWEMALSGIRCAIVQVLLLIFTKHREVCQAQASSANRAKFAQWTQDNRSTLLARPQAMAVLERDRRKWLSYRPVPNTLYVSTDNIEFLSVDDLYWLDEDQAKLWLQFYHTHVLNYGMSPVHAEGYINNLVQAVQAKPHISGLFKHDNHIKIPDALNVRVIARKSIPTYTILGAFSGVILFEGSDQLPSFDLRAELDWLRTAMPGLPASDLYRFGLTLPLTLPFVSSGRNSLLLSSLNRGNVLSFVRMSSADGEEDGMTTETNVESAVLRMNGHIPTLVLYSTKQVFADEELVARPPDGYWLDQKYEELQHIAMSSTLLYSFTKPADTALLDCTWNLQIAHTINSPNASAMLQQQHRNLLLELASLGISTLCLNSKDNGEGMNLEISSDEMSRNSAASKSMQCNKDDFRMLIKGREVPKVFHGCCAVLNRTVPSSEAELDRHGGTIVVHNPGVLSGISARRKNYRSQRA